MRSRALDLVSMTRFIQRTGGPAVIAALTLVVLHYWGIWAGLPWAQYSDEYWAIPLAGVLAVVFLILLLRQRAS